MTLWDWIKKKAKTKYEAEKKLFLESQAYKKELKVKVRASKRTAYEIEAIKQAALRSKTFAKLRYNPPRPKRPTPIPTTDYDFFAPIKVKVKKKLSKKQSRAMINQKVKEKLARERKANKMFWEL